MVCPPGLIYYSIHWGRDKMATFHRWHFQMHFLESKFIDFDFEVLLKFVPKGLINNVPALVQVMAWRWTGVKPLCELMMVRLLTYIYASLGLNECWSCISTDLNIATIVNWNFMNNCSEVVIQIIFFHSRKLIWNVFCKMPAILSQHKVFKENALTKIFGHMGPFS